MFDSKRGRAGGVHARTFRACVSSVCGSIARHSIPGVLTNPAFSWPVPLHFRLTTRYVLVHSQVTSMMPEFSPLFCCTDDKCFPNRPTRSWHYLSRLRS